MSSNRSQYPFDNSSAGVNLAGQMIKGSVLAGLVFFGPVVFILVLKFIGTFLPPESKEAVDPSPDSFSYIVEYEDDRVA